MKRSILIGFLLIFVLSLVPITAYAQGQIPPIPDPVGYVNDFANVCTVGQEQLLDTSLRSLEKDTGVEVAVVTIQDCGEDTTLYRGELFNKWGIGKAGADNGLLVLSCVDQRALEQETGYAMEAVLPDLLTRQAAEEHFVPQAKEGNLCQGLINLVQAYDPVIRGDEYVHVAQAPVQTKFPWGTLLIIIILILLLIGLAALGAFEGSGGGGGGGSSYPTGRSYSPTSSTRSSSPSGGSHSGGFGGGRSGGGGSRTKY